MKYFVILMTFFSSLVTGYDVVNTWSENGVMTVVDKYGNGVDIYVDMETVDVDAEISLYKRDSHVVVVDEIALKDGGHLIRFEVFDQPYPVDTLIIIPGRGLTVSANLLKLGDPKTHEVFERDVISMMRKIAQGGRYEKVWFDCVGALFEFAGFVSGEGRSAGSSSV